MLTYNQKQHIMNSLVKASVNLEEIDQSVESLKQMSDYVKTISTSFIDKVKVSFNHFVEIDEVIKDYLESRNRLGLIADVEKVSRVSKKTVEATPFDRIYNMDTLTVPGLSSDLPGLTVDNLNVIRYCVDNLLNDLNLVNKDISRFISNDELKASFKKMDKKYLDIKDFLLESKEKYSLLIDPKQINDSVKLHKLIGNGKSFITLLNMLNTINDLLPDKQLSKIEKEVSKLKSKIDYVYDTLEDNDTIVTKVALKNLVETISIIADYVTMFSSAYYVHVKSMEAVIQVNNIFIKYKK